MFREDTKLSDIYSVSGATGHRIEKLQAVRNGVLSDFEMIVSNRVSDELWARLKIAIEKNLNMIFEQQTKGIDTALPPGCLSSLDIDKPVWFCPPAEWFGQCIYYRKGCAECEEAFKKEATLHPNLFDDKVTK